MKQLTGNLIDLAEQGNFDVIVHGCNCFHAMRSGIAREISRRYPQAEEADSRTQYGSRSKLGNFSSASVENGGGIEFVIVNAYTQHRWSGVEDVFEYAAFETFLNRLVSFLHGIHSSRNKTVRVGFPKIGCGLAKGDEGRILPMIEKFSKDVSPWAEVSLVSLR